MTNNYLSELSGACAILGILSSALLYAYGRLLAPSLPNPTQPQPLTDDQCRLDAWYTSRTRVVDKNLRHCLDCPPKITVASLSNLGLHYYDHHALQTCRFCNTSYHGNLEGGAHIKVHHPQQLESFSASKKMWWTKACDSHYYRLKRAQSARFYRMAVERRRWASECRAKVGEADEVRLAMNL